METTIKYAHINPYKEDLLELSEELGQSKRSDKDIIHKIQKVMEYVDDVQFEALVNLGKEEQDKDELDVKLEEVLSEIKKHTKDLDE